MLVFRRVMQVLWLVVIAAGAAALVKIAFFPDGTAPVDPAQPGGQIVEPHYTVGLGTVSNDIVLSGTVAADEAVPIPATVSGVVWNVYVTQGQWVEYGTELIRIRGDVLDDAGVPQTVWRTVTAPASGVLSSLTALEDASVAAGSPIGQIAPPTFHVTGSIPPEQLYQLIQRPTEATVTVNGGPAPFQCTNFQILTPLAGETGGDGGQGASGGPSLRCSVPADVTVFAGLTAQVVIPGGIAENVVVVPTTAVLGQAETGVVTVVLPDGGTEERAVELGLSDGAMVEVKSGLAEGETILQFVPGAPSAPGGGVVGPGIVEPGKPIPLDGGGVVVLEDGSVIEGAVR
ncbi:MAG: HlyD family efflux transporter periplasmic adaptor subunit [Microbacteriaceae bacterium]|nr:HlyD family efflux transporter periplasmic adaptor subunit [Microbacteriaceae bacterium]